MMDIKEGVTDHVVKLKVSKYNIDHILSDSPPKSERKDAQITTIQPIHIGKSFHNLSQ